MPVQLGPLAVGVLKRLGVFAASLAAASVLIFLLCAALPGDIAQVILGQSATPEAVAQLRRTLGLDRPLPVQYLDWVTSMVVGDFGTSQVNRVPVSTQISTRLGVTAWLVTGAMLLALLIAIPVGVFAAVHSRRTSGFVVSALSQLGLAVPAFWAGILLVTVFAVQLRWLPANGYVRLREDAGGWLSHLLLPVLALSVVQASVLVRYVRSAILDVSSEDYIRTARAVGWTRTRALLRHGLRNASLSIVTVVGLQLATLFVGAIVVEQVFALPGLGQLLLNAVGQRDLVLVQGTVMVLVFAVLVINALVDLSYLALDPRLRAPRGSR